MILFIVSKKKKNLLSKMLFPAHRYLLYEEWLGISNKNGFRSLSNSFPSNQRKGIILAFQSLHFICLLEPSQLKIQAIFLQAVDNVNSVALDLFLS